MSLRFWFILILLCNATSVWTHATEGPETGRSIVLDFVGPGASYSVYSSMVVYNINQLLIASPPTKLHLLSLDFVIIVLNMVLTTISYETSLHSAMPTDTPDPLLPLPPPSVPATPILFDEDSPKTELSYEPPYVLDLHLSQMIHRLRSPAPPPPERDPSSDDLLPLPQHHTMAAP